MKDDSEKKLGRKGCQVGFGVNTGYGSSCTELLTAFSICDIDRDAILYLVLRQFSLCFGGRSNCELLMRVSQSPYQILETFRYFSRDQWIVESVFDDSCDAEPTLLLVEVM